MMVQSVRNLPSFFTLSVALVSLLASLATIAAAESPGSFCPEDCTCSDAAASDLLIQCPSRINSTAAERNEKLESSRMQLDLDRMIRNLTASEIRITSVTINYTPLMTIPLSICGLSAVSSVNVDHNRLTRIPDNCLIHLAGLTSFSARNNRIAELQDGLFDGLRQLRSVNFDENWIESIGVRLFSNASDLPSLRTVRLQRNRLTSLDPWPLVRGLVTSTSDDRVDVYASDNLIANFTNSIGYSFTCTSRQPFVTLHVDYNKIAHLSDLTAAWGIADLKACICLIGRGTYFILRKNEFICDCVDFEYYKLMHLMQMTTLLSWNFCNAPPRQYNVELTRVPLDELVCELTDQCPPGCRCVSRPANATIHVYCSLSNLTALPVDLPPLPHRYSTYALDFSDVGGSGIRRLETRGYLNRTAVFRATRAGVQEIDGDVWPVLLRMKRVELDGNALTTLQKSDVLDATTSAETAAKNPTGSGSPALSLNLGDNPWRCSCDDEWFGDWLTTMKDRRLLQHPDNIICRSPTRLNGKNILLVPSADFCRDPVMSMVTRTATIVASTIGGLILVIVGVTIVAYRARVRLHARWNIHPFDRDECVGEPINYDVFLCCSSEDHVTHGLPTMQLLETNNYRVCYHLRDFPVGELIETSIVQAVTSSKRTLCLVSKNFVESSYCMREFLVALHQNVTLKRAPRRLIVMILDSSARQIVHQPSADHVAPAAADNDDDDVEDRDVSALRQYVSQYTYIDREADNNWLQKLKYALPLKGIDELEVNCRGQRAENDETELLDA